MVQLRFLLKEFGTRVQVWTSPNLLVGGEMKEDRRRSDGSIQGKVLVHRSFTPWHGLNGGHHLGSQDGAAVWIS